jgi:hypothetical protein
MMQLALFASNPGPIRRDQRDIMYEKICSIAVELDVMTIFNAKPAEWLGWNDFRPIIKKHDVSSCLGHILSRISRSGKTIEKNIYFGSDHPGKPNYLGYTCVYMLAEGPTA